MMIQDQQSAVASIRSQLDIFLKENSDLDILQKKLESVLPSVMNDYGFNIGDTNKLHAWIPKPTLLCPSELNTSAEVFCSSSTHCGTRNCRGDQENDLEEDNPNEKNDGDGENDDTNDYYPSLPKP